MDYKKKYKEALDRARTFSQRWQGIEATDSELALQELKEIFPELKMSDDERIKAEIIAFVEQSIHRGGGTPIPQEKEKRWIDWLEKQGEQKSTTGMSYREIFPKFSVGDTLYRQGWANQTVKKVYIDNINATYICENDEGLESHIEFSEQDEWYKIEKKPAWSEEDEKERKRVVGLLEGWLYTFKKTCYAEDCKCGISWLKSIKQRMKGE